jgi:translation initiation factor IF-1
MVKNVAGGCNGKKVARKHTTKGKNELRLSKSSDEKYAIVKKLLGNTCDVICDDGVDRRCIIRGKFTGRNKRDNMIDSGIYVLVGMREWVDETGRSKQSCDSSIKYCDLLEVYNSMERDILRRTHNIFCSLKDESGNKYDDRDTNVSFVDENTLKYQNVIKKMDGNKASKVGSGDEEGSEEGSEDGEELKQPSIITANIKHIGKGIVVQSYDISDDEDENDDEDDERGGNISENKVMMTYNETFQNPNKKIVYTVDKNIDVDDI